MSAGERFSAEYIALCRKLALPREWQKGDWWLYDVESEPSATGYRADYPYVYGDNFPTLVDARPIWVPQEGDCLDLLVEARYEHQIRIHGGLPGGTARFFVNCYRNGDEKQLSARDETILGGLLKLVAMSRGVDFGEPFTTSTQSHHYGSLCWCGKRHHYGNEE